jgi:DNA-binding CsgD family transcriptional regulator
MFESSNTAVGALLGTFDHFNVGVILSGEKSAVPVNTAAQATIDNGSGLNIINNQLWASEPTEQRVLRKMMDETLLDGYERAMTISPDDPRSRIFLLIHRFDAEPFSHVIYCIDPQQNTYVSPDLLATWLNLTPKQSQVAARIAGGQPIDEAAVELGMTVGTARTHLKHIYMKTQCANQLQLVGLVRTVPFRSFNNNHGLDQGVSR